jgi:hypothetical protein
MFPFDRHTRLRESLSAYIDGALTDVERTRLESHLTTCDACRSVLDGLRVASEALRGLPAIAAPRSFSLTEAMVQVPAPAPAGYSPVLNTAMRLSAGGLAVALAAVMVVDRADLGGDGNGGAGGQRAARSLDSADMERLTAGEDASQEPQVSPILIGGADRGAGGAPAEAPDATTAPLEVGTAFGETPAASANDKNTDEDAVRDSQYQSEAEATAGTELQPAPLSDNAEEEPADVLTTEDRGDGIGAIGVIEIVLAILLGSAIGGALALTAARRKSGVGTN